jgi:hypothetical protein
MKKIIIFAAGAAAALLIAGLSACGTAKRGTGSSEMSKEEFMQADTLAEVMPTFQGGDIGLFRNWLVSRLRYPSSLMSRYVDGYRSEYNLEGQVIASFVIDVDGKVKNVTISSSPDVELSRTVQNAIRSSPTWTPGYSDGKAVSVIMFLPVEFRLPPQTLNELRRQRDAKSNTAIGSRTGTGYGSRF